MEDDTILDSQITASSSVGVANWYPEHGRLNQGTAWSTHTLDLNQWLQVVFNADQFLYGLQTTGRANEWTKKYKVDYSTDGGTTWMPINGADGNPEVRHFILRNIWLFKDTCSDW